MQEDEIAGHGVTPRLGFQRSCAALPNSCTCCIPTNGAPGSTFPPVPLFRFFGGGSDRFELTEGLPLISETLAAPAWGLRGIFPRHLGGGSTLLDVAVRFPLHGLVMGLFLLPHPPPGRTLGAGGEGTSSRTWGPWGPCDSYLGGIQRSVAARLDVLLPRKAPAPHTHQP